jgi:hypothetical protein
MHTEGYGKGRHHPDATTTTTITPHRTIIVPINISIQHTPEIHPSSNVSKRASRELHRQKHHQSITFAQKHPPFDWEGKRTPPPKLSHIASLIYTQKKVRKQGRFHLHPKSQLNDH